MPEYYCPYCSSGYKVFLTKGSEDKHCIFCGETLERCNLVTFPQVAALIVVFSFLSPFLIMYSEIFQKPKNNYPSKSFLPSEVVKVYSYSQLSKY